MLMQISMMAIAYLREDRRAFLSSETSPFQMSRRSSPVAGRHESVHSRSPFGRRFGETLM